MTSSVPAQAVEQLRKEAPTELQLRPQLAVVYYAFNLTRAPFRDAPGLREALSIVVDRERLTESVLKAGQVPAYGFVPPGIPGYERAEYSWRIQPWAARLARARRLYREAGYSAERPLRLTLLCPEDDTLKRTTLAVASMWQEALGVVATPVYREYRSFLAARAAREEWDVLSHGWNADYPDPGNFLQIFASNGVQNDPALADPALDGLLSDSAAEADGGRRLELLTKAERRLLEDYAVAPLYFAVSRRLVKPRVAGAVLGPMNHNYSKYLSFRTP